MRPRATPFALLGRYFFRGLLVTAPAAVTLYVLWVSFRWLDNLLDFRERLGIPVPGLGLVLVLAAVTLIGFLASTIAARFLFGLSDRLFARLPLVRLVYTSIRDLLEAFVGETKRFDRPVLVTIDPASGTKVLGFVTRESLDDFGIEGHVAVYLPQSYNFAGQLLVVPRAHAVPIGADRAAVMTLIVSGGVSTTPAPLKGPAGRAIMDGRRTAEEERP